MHDESDNRDVATHLPQVANCQGRVGKSGSETESLPAARRASQRTEMMTIANKKQNIHTKYRTNCEQKPWCFLRWPSCSADKPPNQAGRKALDPHRRKTPATAVPPRASHPRRPRNERTPHKSPKPSPYIESEAHKVGTPALVDLVVQLELADEEERNDKRCERSGARATEPTT